MYFRYANGRTQAWITRNTLQNGPTYTSSTIQRLETVLERNSWWIQFSSLVLIKSRIAHSAGEETPSNDRTSGHASRKTPSARELSRDVE